MATVAPITVEGAPATPAGPVPLPPGVSERAIPTEDPGHVALTDPDGVVQSVPIANAERAVRQYGYRPATDTEYFTAKTGTAGTVAATVAGLGRGPIGGIYDLATIETSRFLEGDKGAEETRQTLRMLKEGHPDATMAAEIGGSLATLAVGLPPAAAEARAAVAAEGTAARVGAWAARNAPRLMAEGAGISMSQQLSEDVLGDHELTAGKYLAAGLEGGAFGLLLGAGLSAAGAGLKRAAGHGGAALVAAEEKAGARSLAGKVEDAAAAQAFKATGAKIGTIEKLGKTAEQQEAAIHRLGRTWLDEGIVTATASKTDMAARVAEKVEKYGAEIGSLRKGLERSAVRPETAPILQRIEDEVLMPLASKSFAQGERSAIRPYMQELADKMAGKEAFGSFEELQALRQDLAERIYPKAVKGAAPPAAPAGFEHLQKVERILESEYEAAAARAAEDLVEEFSTKYTFAKGRYADLKTAEKILSKETAREVANRAISLTDTIAGAGGASAGVTALFAGHPLTAAAALAMPLVNKAVRTYGNQAAAVALDRISKLEALQAAAVKFDERLAGSVKAFFKDGPPPAMTAKASKVSPADRQALRAAVTNPAVLTEHVADYAARTGLRDAAPNVTAALTQSLMRAATWVQQKLPREPAPIGVSFGAREPRALGPRAQAEMERALSALDVDQTLDALAHNRLSREQVEAIKFVNPPLFAAMRKAVRDYGMENDPSVSIQQEMAMRIIFDTPVSKYTQPATVRGFQQAFAQGAPPDPAQAGGPQPTPLGSGESKAARSLASPTDRMEASDAL